MREEYEKLIIELDKVLSMVRKMWMETNSPEDKAKWKTRINESLDERFRLMTERDKDFKPAKKK